MLLRSSVTEVRVIVVDTIEKYETLITTKNAPMTIRGYKTLK